MILQDLLRNIVLYKGVIRPVLQSWKESLVAVYLKPPYLSVYHRTSFPLSEAGEDRFRAGANSQYSFIYSTFSLSELSGTRTISYADLISINNSTIKREERASKSALTSNNLLTVLTTGLVVEDTVAIGKTHLRSHVSSTGLLSKSLSQSRNATTGYTYRETYFFLSLETHEKREYLGEFSLTHEETPLLYLKEGGEYHDIDQKSAGAII